MLVLAWAWMPHLIGAPAVAGCRLCRHGEHVFNACVVCLHG